MTAAQNKTPELEAHWTLEADERAFVKKSKVLGARLGFGVLFKFFQHYGRFPQSNTLIALPIVEYLAQQIDAKPTSWESYALEGRSAKEDRALIRNYFGFRRAGLKQLEDLGDWLFQQAGQLENDPERLKEASFERLRSLQLEPPANDELNRKIKSVAERYEREFCEDVYHQLSNVTINRLNGFLDPISQLPKSLQEEDAAELMEEDEQGFPRAIIQYLKSGPGQPNFENIQVEADKLERIRAAKVPGGVFGMTPTKIIYNLKKRACVEEPFEFKRHPVALKMTLLSAFSLIRAAELTDNLVEQLDNIIHRIGVKAEQRLEKEMLGELKRISGKFKLRFSPKTGPF